MTSYPLRASGAIAKGLRIRNEYIANPNLCKFCNSPILPRPGVKLTFTRIKKFCNQSCASKFNNPLKAKKEHYRICAICNNKFLLGSPKSSRTRCPVHAGRKKVRDLYNRGSMSHSEIREHARQATRSRPKICQKCGYNKFVETAHIIPISKFSPETLLEEMNADNNLLVLCPNCHWEFDHGMFKLVAASGFEPEV